ncbi:HAMP domain-containing histidine kinase [Reichenbachiella carrageenanivorans]|uniref:histidine kinase n=1 Tax=Reichenbachiella carrageenanivorans TaxID=2979869 RepID=A0ABY6CXK9_9BACT|nr:HAMP domain-containing sensor histidine kinase [Reichenbachiella carrageenanivorans]UXX78459.1 HAMP domain-containing histidine kinase [Reichenbachiella carrageenanivorans]
MKIQNKIIYLVIIIFVLYTLLYSGFIYYSISNYAFTDFYKRLEIRAATTAKIKLEKPSDVSHILEMEQEYLEKLPNQTEYILPIIKGKIQEDSLSKLLPKSLIEEVLDNTYGSDSEGVIFYSGITYQSQNGDEFMVVVSAENYFYSHHIAYLRTLLLTSLAFGILWIVFFSFVVSRTLIRPIKNIINDVRKISSENLHLRLNVPKKNDSLSRLALTFNDMLNRLETSFETQKNFISNASHELNTPLTSIIGEADFALSKERGALAYKVALGKILEEAEKLDKKTKALLFLAQTGFNGKAQKFDKIRIDQLILDVQDTVQKINSGFKFKLDFSLLPENPEKLKVKGNEQLLHLALSNIMVNACKYSDNEVVHIAFGATDKDAFIVIRDSGIGIPENELQYIYDPYFRASNTGSHEGYGIGLPLSRNIIKMHDGTLQVNSKLNGGTTVLINIPIGNYSL